MLRLLLTYNHIYGNSGQSLLSDNNETWTKKTYRSNSAQKNSLFASEVTWSLFPYTVTERVESSYFTVQHWMCFSYNMKQNPAFYCYHFAIIVVNFLWCFQQTSLIIDDRPWAKTPEVDRVASWLNSYWWKPSHIRQHISERSSANIKPALIWAGYCVTHTFHSQHTYIMSLNHSCPLP